MSRRAMVKMSRHNDVDPRSEARGSVACRDDSLYVMAFHLQITDFAS